MRGTCRRTWNLLAHLGRLAEASAEFDRPAALTRSGRYSEGAPLSRPTGRLKNLGEKYGADVDPGGHQTLH